MRHFPATYRGTTTRRGQLAGYRAVGVGGDLPDPFADQPVRRSAGLVIISLLIVFAPLIIGGPLGTTILLSAG